MCEEINVTPAYLGQCATASDLNAYAEIVKTHALGNPDVLHFSSRVRGDLAVLQAECDEPGYLADLCFRVWQSGRYVGPTEGGARAYCYKTGGFLGYAKPEELKRYAPGTPEGAVDGASVGFPGFVVWLED